MADILAVGFTIFISFFLVIRWIPLPRMLWLLGHPMKIDITISVLIFLMFGGTLTGGAAAMLAAVLLSVMLSIARNYMGYFDPKSKMLVRGHINLDRKLRKYLKPTGEQS